MRLSPHFTLSEMTSSQTARRLGITNSPPPHVIAALTALCINVLEPVRAHFGRPVVVSSGYRSPALNRAVRGSASSQHVRGEAADIEVPGVHNIDVARWIAANCEFDQLILEFPQTGDPSAGWVHVSWRPVGRRKDVKTALRRRRLGVLRTVYLPGLVK